MDYHEIAERLRQGHRMREDTRDWCAFCLGRWPCKNALLATATEALAKEYRCNCGSIVVDQYLRETEEGTREPNDWAGLGELADEDRCDRCKALAEIAAYIEAPIGEEAEA